MIRAKPQTLSALTDIEGFGASRKEKYGRELLGILTASTGNGHTVEASTAQDEAVRVLPVTQGIPFLGFRIFPGVIRLDGKKWARFRRRVRQQETQYACGTIEAD